MIPFVSGMQCVFAAVSFSSSARCSSFIALCNECVLLILVKPRKAVCCQRKMAECLFWIWYVRCCPLFPCVVVFAVVLTGSVATDDVMQLVGKWLPAFKVLKKKRTRYLDGNCTPGGAASLDCLCTLPDTVGVVGCCQPFSRDQITSSSDSWTSPMILCLLPSSGHTSW